MKELYVNGVYTGDGGAGSYCSLLYGHKSRLEVKQSVIINTKKIYINLYNFLQSLFNKFNLRNRLKHNYLTIYHSCSTYELIFWHFQLKYTKKSKFNLKMFI